MKERIEPLRNFSEFHSFRLKDLTNQLKTKKCLVIVPNRPSWSIASKLKRRNVFLLLRRKGGEGGPYLMKIGYVFFNFSSFLIDLIFRSSRLNISAVSFRRPDLDPNRLRYLNANLNTRQLQTVPNFGEYFDLVLLYV